MNEQLTENVTEDQPEKKNKKWAIILIMMGALIMGVGLYGLIPIFKDYYTSAKSYSDLEAVYVKVNDTNIGETMSAKAWYEMAEVDVDALKSQYSNVIGWLFFENEDISYPIMQTDDNAYYLKKGYDGTYAYAGSIFMDMYNTPDFSDFHTIIYGHNMKDLSMFGKLKYYKNQGDYYEDHKYFQVFTEDEILRYEIFAYQECSVESNIFQVSGSASPSELLKEMYNKSMISSGIVVGEDDHVITLSTCSSSDDYRFIVNAVLVDRHPLNGETE